MLKHWADKMKEKLMERAESGQKTDMLSYYNFSKHDHSDAPALNADRRKLPLMSWET